MWPFKETPPSLNGLPREGSWLLAQGVRPARPDSWMWLAVLLLLSVACGGASPSSKRLAPPEVPPVTIDNVRFEAPSFDSPCNQNGGCVVAYDNTTDDLLWFVRVYCVSYGSNVEKDVQDVFITALVVDNGQLLVTNEEGRHFFLDPSTHEVTGDATGCGDGGLSCDMGRRSGHSGGGRFVGLALSVGVLMLFRRRARARLWGRGAGR